MTNKIRHCRTAMVFAVLFAAVAAAYSQGAMEEQAARFRDGFNDLATNVSDIRASAAARAFAPAPIVSEGVSRPNDNILQFYGADSRQARMEFTAYVLYKVPGDYAGSDAQLLSDPARRKEISETVDLQLQHMYGAFSTHPAFVDNPGIPSGDYKVGLLSAERVPGGPYARIAYSYSDMVVFARKRFRGGSTPLKFVLPRDPVTIYAKGFPAPGSSTNLCTDGHYNSEGDFWYFWNPYQEGCPISEDDLVEVRTSLTPMMETKNTYPEYARLYGENGSGETLNVTYLVGVDENFRESDLGNKTFQASFAGLKAAGFRATSDEPRRKKLTFRFGVKNTVIEMVLADPNSVEFAREAVRGMSTADVFLYDGHSGLGGHLSLERLAEDTGAPLALPMDKYQIFAFEGCSTYAYYNSAYFRLKRSDSDPKGTKNLDIITTGIGADFSVGAAVDVAFLTSVTAGDRPSWQTIMDRIRAAEGKHTALSHVNGDEDNPNTP